MQLGVARWIAVFAVFVVLQFLQYCNPGGDWTVVFAVLQLGVAPWIAVFAVFAVFAVACFEVFAVLQLGVERWIVVFEVL